MRGHGFDHAGAGAIGARLAKHALERLLGALARDATRPNSLKDSAFEAPGRAQRLLRNADITFSRLRRSSMSMKSSTMMPPRSRRRIWRTISFTASRLVLTMVSSRRVEPLAHVLAGVDVDGHERFGVVDDDVAAGLEPDLGAQGLVEFLLDAELLEDRRILGVELHAADELGLEAADELDDLAELLLVVDPDGGVIVADVVAQNALDEIEIAVEQGGSLARLGCVLIFSQVRAEEFDVAANLLFGGAARGGANDEAAGKVPLASVTTRRRRERSSAELILRETPM